MCSMTYLYHAYSLFHVYSLFYFYIMFIHCFTFISCLFIVLRHLNTHSRFQKLWYYCSFILLQILTHFKLCHSSVLNYSQDFLTNKITLMTGCNIAIAYNNSGTNYVTLVNVMRPWIHWFTKRRMETLALI